MSDITKKVHRLVPINERSQTFTQADASAGDVIMVKDSLGRPARKVLIEAGDTMSVRFNVYQNIFPLREHWMDDFGAWNPGQRNLALGSRVKDNEGVSISIEADGTLELDKDIPVSDIELLTVSGEFTVTVM
jgi:predicted hydrocarbon binding protein